MHLTTGLRAAALSAAMLVIATDAHANAFDDCVVETLRGTTSDVAARSLKVACLRKSSVEIPAEMLVDLTGTAEYGDFGKNIGTGFWIQLENKTKFVITEITIKVQVGDGKVQYFRTDDFWTPTPGVVYAGPPPDPTRSMQIAPYATVNYRVLTKQPDIDVKKQKYKWGIASARGIPTAGR